MPRQHRGQVPRGRLNRSSRSGRSPSLRGFSDLRRLRPWTRWNVDSDLSADVLRLFTIQARPAYDALVATGVHRPAPEHAAADWSTAYGWLRRQMAERLPTTGNTAVWLWARTTWRELAHQARSEPGDEQVLLEVRAPREYVLLSSFDDWHQVLNTSLHVPPLPHELADNNGWWSRAEPLLDDFDRRVDEAMPGYRRSLEDYPPELRRELETSWTHIFDPATWGRRATIQATIHELRVEHVVRALRCR